MRKYKGSQYLSILVSIYQLLTKHSNLKPLFLKSSFFSMTYLNFINPPPFLFLYKHLKNIIRKISRVLTAQT